MAFNHMYDPLIAYVVMYKTLIHVLGPFIACILFMFGAYQEMTHFLTFYYILHSYSIKKDTMYLIHHLISIGLCSQGFFHIIPFRYAQIIFLSEISAIFVNLFYEVIISRRILCIIYIPIRCIWIPYILLSIHDNNYIVRGTIWILIIGSYWWSYKMIKHLVFNPICFLGVLQFIQTYLFFNSYIAFFVSINGLLYHGIGNAFTRYLDIFCNILFVVYVNLNTNSQIVPMLITFAITCYYLNIFSVSQYFNIYHVIFVQSILNIALCYFLYENFNNT